MRAAELGKTLRTLLAEAGLGHDTVDKIPAVGRRIDTLEKIAVAFNWSLAEVMGFSLLGRISRPLSKLAWGSARRVLSHLPRAAQTDDHLMDLHASVYDLLAERESAGLSMDPDVLTKDVLPSFEKALLHLWEQRGRTAGG